ncbi:nuclear transport factor 2 family protein [Mucilaginibacter limnophilus]|uniref:Nuclear transport factor 2 family protein n=1 Tax=Mucilaginibacter limnophilus TaxID=1932778 RepID=A0A3S2URI9_9SPHI|nr:nuclear transport factor 2 family protein [Mucilaginibacter limnophilus]RVU02896.1 nuclear transport factor 2 family protein [Mucilaginibacter limnophilus]
MNLPVVISKLVATQNALDSEAYTECFTEQAVVHDEGKTHHGKGEIQQWIEHSNQEYRALMKPLNYEQTENEGVLTAEVAGTFPGSPAVLQFYLTLENDLICALKVTG